MNRRHLGLFILALATGLSAFLGIQSSIDAGRRSARSTWAFRNMPEVPALYEGRFITSPECALCHSNDPSSTALRDAKNRPVGPYDLWQSTMMANSARDPFWRAVVSAEVANNPGAKAEIEAKCLRCHSPMASQHAKLTGQSALGMEVLYGKGDIHDLARDGVSCMACHQISRTGLGTPASFTGNFRINESGLVYGPHPRPIGGPMIGHTGFFPFYSEHISQSKLCGSCHTLYTPALDENSQPTGEVLLEQGPYIEWRNSIYSTESKPKGASAKDCQDCHMPQTDIDGHAIRTRIVRPPDGGEYRVPVRNHLSRHIFVGGNTLLPQIFKRFRDELGPNASDEAFDATRNAAIKQLQSLTADVEIRDLKRVDGRLVFNVRVTNDCGHKFPSAYPSRRAWLHVTVKDSTGAVVFESGAFNDRGELLTDGKVRASESTGGFEPHHTTITDASQVQVYECVMRDAKGNPTWRLLRGGGFIKDNRLLPRGWASDGPHADETKPVGVDDANFVGGRDDVRFELALKGQGKLTVEVELVYQTLGWRYANELFKFDTPEVLTFREYLRQVDTSPVQVATTKK